MSGVVQCFENGFVGVRVGCSIGPSAVLEVSFLSKLSKIR